MEQEHTSIAGKKTTALALFEYVVVKLVGIDQPPAMTIEESHNKLRQHSLSRYMKILYLLGLTSCTIALEEDEDRRKPHNSPPERSLYQRCLFHVFNDITTFPNGPVVYEVYRALKDRLSISDGMLFKVDRGLSLNDGISITEVHNRMRAFETEHAHEADLVKKSLERLFGGAYTPPGDREATGLPGIKYKEIDSQMIIDVSHSFPAWIATTQDIEEELYAQKGIESIFDFIYSKGIKGNISRYLKDGDNLRDELKAFEKFRRNP